MHTYLALTMFPAFSSTISSKPMAKISMGLALLSVKRKNKEIIYIINASMKTVYSITLLVILAVLPFPVFVLS